MTLRPQNEAGRANIDLITGTLPQPACKPTDLRKKIMLIILCISDLMAFVMQQKLV